MFNPLFIFRKIAWKWRYAQKLKETLGLSMKEAWADAEAALESIDYDLRENPVEIADAEVDCWLEETEPVEFNESL